MANAKSTVADTKYTLELSAEQNGELAEIQEVLKARSKADAIRKALGLAALVVDVTKNNQRLAIVDDKGHVVEIIRFV